MKCPECRTYNLETRHDSSFVYCPSCDMTFLENEVRSGVLEKDRKPGNKACLVCGGTYNGDWKDHKPFCRRHH